MAAWDQGCKGCTTYRPNDVTGSVLTVSEKQTAPVASQPVTGGEVVYLSDPLDRPGEIHHLAPVTGCDATGAVCFSDTVRTDPVTSFGR